MTHEFSDNSAHDESWRFLEELDEEMQGDILGRDQEDFRKAIALRSDVIGKSLAVPDNTVFFTALNDVHDKATESFEKYLRSLFDVPMDDDIRRTLITQAFVETDVSQKVLNDVIYDCGVWYDLENLTEDIKELLQLEDNESKEKIVQKFRGEFGEGIQDFLALRESEDEDEDDDFWTKGDRKGRVDTLNAELEDEDFIQVINKFYAAQNDRLNAIEMLGPKEISEAHRDMINAFRVCVDATTYVTKDSEDPMERVEIVTGLFRVTDETQNSLFSQEDYRGHRYEGDFTKLRQKIAIYDKNMADIKFRNRVVALFRNEFTADLDILLNKLGKTDQ